MKFSTNEDIAAPIDAVFQMLTDFETFERAAMRRGAEVQRTDRLFEPGVGMTWRASFKVRGKLRQVDLEMVRYERPSEIAVESRSPGMEGSTQLEFIALSRSRTRVRIEIEVKPLTLSARLLLQSLKLAKNSLNRRFKKRVADYATSLEERYAGQSGGLSGLA